MSGAGRAATPALARRHEVTADSGATHIIAEEGGMKKNDINRWWAERRLPAADRQRWIDSVRELDDPRRAMDEAALLYAVSRGRRRTPAANSRAIIIETIEVIAALHDMEVDAEAMVARAEAENHPLGLTVIEGGGGGSPPSATPAGGSPAPATPPAAA